MANLDTKTISDGVGDILAVHGGVTGSSKNVKDGAGGLTPLWLTTTKVGIGATAPGYSLDVSGTGVQSMRVQSTDDSAQLIIASSDGSAETSNSNILLQSGADSGGTIHYDHHATAASQKMVFTVGDCTTGSGTTAMTILGDGKVGIGETAPDAPLEIGGSAAMMAHIKSSHSTPYFRVERTSNTTIDLAAGSSSYGGGLLSSTELRFCVSAAAITAPSMTIDTNGNVGIGATAPTAELHVEATNLGSNPMLLLSCSEPDIDSGEKFMQIIASADTNIHGSVVRLITFHDAGGEMGYITTASDGVVNAITASDVRLKKDIRDTAINGLSIINTLKIRDFSWNDKAGVARNDLSVTAQYVADEVYEVYPLATTGTPGAMKTEITPAVEAVEAVAAKDAVLDSDGNIVEAAIEAIEAVAAVAEKTEEVIDAMGVSEGRLVSVLVKAVQELSAKVTALENA